MWADPVLLPSGSDLPPCSCCVCVNDEHAGRVYVWPPSFSPGGKHGSAALVYLLAACVLHPDFKKQLQILAIRSPCRPLTEAVIWTAASRGQKLLHRAVPAAADPKAALNLRPEQNQNHGSLALSVQLSGFCSAAYGSGRSITRTGGRVRSSPVRSPLGAARRQLWGRISDSSLF